MKTISVYFNQTLLAQITRPTFEEAEHVGLQYQAIFGGGSSFRIERISQDDADSVAEFEA